MALVDDLIIVLEGLGDTKDPYARGLQSAAKLLRFTFERQFEIKAKNFNDLLNRVGV